VLGRVGRRRMCAHASGKKAGGLMRLAVGGKKEREGGGSAGPKERRGEGTEI
jgi:hypothetical protein